MIKIEFYLSYYLCIYYLFIFILLFLWLLSTCTFASLIFLHLPLKPVPWRTGGGVWEGKRRLQTIKFQSQHLYDVKSLAFFIYH